MSDPYEVLGIRPTATVAEAEAAYRRLLKECHPDRYHGDGPEVVARAEQRTRDLNDAMVALRRRGDDPWLRPDPDAAWNRPDRDPAADPRFADPSEQLTCPWCQLPVADVARLIAHTSSAHPAQAGHEVGVREEPPGFLRSLGMPVWAVGSLVLALALLRQSGAGRNPATMILVLWLIALPTAALAQRALVVRERERRDTWGTRAPRPGPSGPQSS